MNTDRDCTHGQLVRSCNICDLEQEIANLKVKLQEMIKQLAANTPIQELMAQYSDECCDFSDLHWLRETAMRLVTTMPDSQARCILFALAGQIPSVPVLTVECEPDYWSRGHYHEGTKPYIAPTAVWKLPIGTKLYTAPVTPDAKLAAAAER